MLNDDAVFAFDLHESLYFENGQEVAEMKGISLDPEIAIQDYGDYISIRGVIELQGEYIKHNTLTETGMDDDISDHQAKRFVERVMDTEDNEATFMHRFPVEISIPSYRVTSLDDVSVDIEAFDYELPYPSQLKFTSKIAIHGIEDEHESDETESNERSDETEETHYEPGEGFTFESKKIPEEPDIAHHENVEDIPETNHVEQEAPEEETNEHSDEEVHGTRWKWKETQTLGEFFGKDVSTESAGDKSVETTPSDTTEFHEMVEDPEPYSYETESGSYVTESLESSPQEVRDVIYLADMFREEEEHYSKMRLCIVQPEDTIDTIASKYDVKTEHILSQNKLEGEAVSEGQLLYIPSSGLYKD